MDIQYTYLKKRKTFGCQPLFCEVPAQMLDTIAPKREEQKQFILRNPVHETIQVGPTQSQCEVNTIPVLHSNSGANHAEGGWPKDVNYLDEDAVMRHHRRIERDDGYIQAILNTYPKLEYNIKQNNAIEMYEMYFSKLPPEKPVEKYFITVKSTYIDKKLQGAVPPVACIDWTAEEDAKIVASICDKMFPLHVYPRRLPSETYLWNVENPGDPYETLESEFPCWQIACSPANRSLIFGGFEDGRVCIFDIREKREPTAISPPHLAHRDPITSLLCIQSRSNNEFFCGSTDGQCKWWDIRNMTRPTETMIIALSVPPGKELDLRYAEPVSSLQFDRSFPTKFLCGTDTGMIVSVNRKGKTISEIMTAVFYAHYGPVRAIHRSPLTSKMFISCGDWTTHVWSDEVTICPILSGSRQRYQVNDVCWAPHKISAYMTISADGKFRFWDLLRKHKAPIVSYVVSKHPLVKMKIHEDGRFLAIGDKKGVIHLMILSPDLIVSGEKDKPVMLQTYERETKRERILENRVKEIRLKQRAEEEGAVTEPVIEENEDYNCQVAEDAYRKMINNQLLSLGVSPIKATKSDIQRKR